MVAQGDKSWFGWPTDPEMEKLRDAYAKETDPAKAKALAHGRAEPRARDRAVWLDRPVVRTGCRARQHHRLAQGAGAGDVEHREEIATLSILLSSAPRRRVERALKSDRIV